MTMESPGVTSTSASSSPVAETPPMMHTLQPMVVSSSTDGHITVSAQQYASMAQFSNIHPSFVMAPSGKDQHMSLSGHNMMQPPSSVPLMVPPYQMILPTQGLIDQHALLQQQQAENNSRAATPGSPAVGSRSSTPATVYQQHILQMSDAQGKSDHEAASSPARQGSVGSGGSPAPNTPGSLGSPLTQGLQLHLQPGQIPMNIQMANTPESTEEKLDISKLKPPKKPLTPYMRFSKSIWPQVKAVNQTLSVCEIGATIGRMWRELADTEKQKYNEDFANDKIRYDTDLQEYLKITGLQASDLVKQRPKKKAAQNKDAKKHAQSPKASPATQQQSAPVQQIQNQHVWTNQQGTTILSQGHGQEQLYVQQGPNGQQVLVNALGVPQGTVVNGSTGTGDNVINTPILIQPSGEQTTLFSTGEVDGDKDGHSEGTHVSQATMAQLAALGWQQVIGNPNDLQQQQHMINLINMAAAQSGVQPDQLTQAAQIAGLQPPGIPLGLHQVSIGTTSTDSNSESQSGDQGMITHVLTSESSQNGMTQAIQNGPHISSSQAVVTLAGVQTAHSLYNSYGFNPWSAFQGQVVQTAEIQHDGTSEGHSLGGIQVVYNRENILEAELQHLRNALSEKTKEVQRLSQELEKAYNIIEQLKQQNPTAVIQLPAPQGDGLDQEGPPSTSST